jgi:hypothetical protein
VRGQLQRSNKPQQLRGLNENHNHEMKEIFKGAATRASCGGGPFHEFYVGLLDKGMKPEMARLTLARKIAAITLALWKIGRTLRRRTTENASSLSIEQNPGDLSRFSCLGGGRSVLAMLGFEGEYRCTH